MDKTDRSWFAREPSHPLGDTDDSQLLRRTLLITGYVLGFAGLAVALGGIPEIDVGGNDTATPAEPTPTMTEPGAGDAFPATPPSLAPGIGVADARTLTPTADAPPSEIRSTPPPGETATAAPVARAPETASPTPTAPPTPTATPTPTETATATPACGCPPTEAHRDDGDTRVVRDE